MLLQSLNFTATTTGKKKGKKYKCSLVNIYKDKDKEGPKFAIQNAYNNASTKYINIRAVWLANGS